MGKLTSNQFSIIPSKLLFSIHGGQNDNSSTPVQVHVISNGEVAAGKVGVNIPVTPNTTVSPYIIGDTVNGVTGGGTAINMIWD